MIQHENVHGFLPTAGWWGSWLGDPDRGFGGRQPGGWIYNILPFIEEQQIHDLGAGLTEHQKWAVFQDRDAITLTIMNCPSRRASMPYPNGMGHTPVNSRKSSFHSRSDYAANAGDIQDLEEVCEPIFPASYMEADEHPKSNWPPTVENSRLSDGRDVYNGTAFCGTVAGYRMITDGLSKTYLVGERYLNPDEYDTGLDHGDDWSMWSGYQDDNCRSTYLDPDDPNDNRVPLQDTPGIQDAQRFGSAHPGGCNMAFGDGSVQLISYDIEAEIHRRNGNRFDGGVPRR